MASIFDRLHEAQRQAERVEVETQIAQSAPLDTGSPMPPKKACACQLEEKLARINTRLSIAVHVIALFFFLIAIFRLFKK